MRRPGKQLVGRATWNVADQVVSSGTNLLLSLVVARSLAAEGFGAFAIAFTVYSLLIGASRALIAQPLLVRYLSRGDQVFRDAARWATAIAALLGVASGVVTVAAGWIIGGPVGASLAAIGVMLPALLLQDMWRAVFTSQGRPELAFVNDVVWGVVQFGAVAVLLLLDIRTAPAMILAWGAAALVAAVLGGFQFKGHPRIAGSIAWLVAQRDLLGYYAASFLSVLGANQASLLIIAGLGSPADIGAIRASQVVLGPLNLAGYSLSAVALPEVSRRQLSGRSALRIAVALSALMVVVDLICGLVLILLPPEIGELLLGDSWRNAQAVLPAVLLGVVAVGLGFGASTLIAARGFAKDAFRINLLLAPGFLILGTAGLLLGGAFGAALGLSLAQLIVVPVSWWRVIVLMRREERAGKPASTGTTA